MKIRHPLLIKIAGFAISCVVRTWVGTVRYKCRALDPTVNPLLPNQNRRFFYSFWHETMLMPSLIYRRTPSKVLISEHADGEMIALACQHLGLGLVRGSSTRGGVKAIREMMALENAVHLVVTPDGPRGPRRQVQPGLIWLASHTGMPIVPTGFGYSSCYRLKSWDRFAIPHPCSRAVGVISEPILVPSKLDREGLESWRLVVQRGMDRVQDLAERMAAGQLAIRAEVAPVRHEPT